MNNIPDVMCSTCIHFDVCTYKSIYLSFLANAANDFDFIRDIGARCALYHNCGMDGETGGGWYTTICTHSEVDS